MKRREFIGKLAASVAVAAVVPHVSDEVDVLKVAARQVEEIQYKPEALYLFDEISNDCKIMCESFGIPECTLEPSRIQAIVLRPFSMSSDIELSKQIIDSDIHL